MIHMIKYIDLSLFGPGVFFRPPNIIISSSHFPRVFFHRTMNPTPSRPKRKAAIDASVLIKAELAEESQIQESGTSIQGASTGVSLSSRKRSRSTNPPSTHDAVSTSASSPHRSSSPSVTPNRANKKRKMNIHQSSPGVYVPGPVFDTCNEVRRKIRALISKGEITISDFLRQLGGINSNSYRQFMTMKRPMQGSGNCIYPAAYHFFEQQRLAAGKPKSKLRLESEIAFPQGHSLQPNWGRCIVPYGTIPIEDRLGRITVVPKYPKPRPLSMKQLEKLLADDT